MIYLGALIGGGSGSFVYSFLGQRYLYLVAVGLFVISLLLSLLTKKDENLGKERDLRELYKRLNLDIRRNIGYFRNPKYLILLLSIIVTTMIFGPFFNF